MAKGKQAARAANRRLEATQDHVDRLTEQLAEAKMRARDAEARAAESDRLRARVGRLQREVDEGPSEACLDKLRWWAEVSKADTERRKAAIRELTAYVGGVSLCASLTQLEKFELAIKVLPHTFAALIADDVENVRRIPDEGARYHGDRSPTDPAKRRKWYAYVQRERNPDEALVGDLADILAAAQEGFTSQEIVEMMPDRVKLKEPSVTP